MMKSTGGLRGRKVLIQEDYKCGSGREFAVAAPYGWRIWLFLGFVTALGMDREKTNNCDVRRSDRSSSSPIETYWLQYKGGSTQYTNDRSNYFRAQ